ncbi:hypothetical protein HPB50_014817 [Hyalomma asiaticum]|uniref:Uncharacterized protein n=1 Tax=Hyalomma asiaticum TaxID=266040 RepID=A0ACB7SN85_HYAAI|nr:hypothetical protein HPB50_014817 [Hyalomma asiaticum]
MERDDDEGRYSQEASSAAPTSHPNVYDQSVVHSHAESRSPISEKSPPLAGVPQRHESSPASAEAEHLPPTPAATSMTTADLHSDTQQQPPPAVLEAASAFMALRGAHIASRSSKLSPMSASSPDLSLSSCSDTEEEIAEGPVDPIQLMPAPDAVVRQANKGSGAAPFMLCFAVLVLLALAAVLVVKEVLHFSNLDRNGGSWHFCCPEGVQALAKYVNATLDPCDSFFEFVCSNVVERSPGKNFLPHLSLRREFELHAIGRSNVSRSKAGAFLRSLFDSCQSSASDEHAMIGKLATFLISAGGAYLRHVGTTNALAFLLLSNLKYGISSVVSVKLKAQDAISIAVNTHHDLNDTKFQQCLKHSLAKYNNYAENNVSVAEVTAFARTLRARFPADFTTERFSGANLSALFQKLNLMAALNIISIGLDHLTEVDLSGRVQMDALFGAFGSTENRHGNVGGAYILASSVYHGLVELAWPSVHTKSGRLSFCTRQIDLLPRVRDAMYSDEFVTPARKLQMTRAINAVIETIASDCASSSLFDSSDTVRLKSLFESMSLIVPGETARPDIAVASGKESFFERLLQGRVYEFEAQLAMARLGFPVTNTSGREHRYLLLHNGVSILVFPAAFALLRDDTTHTDAFNTPCYPLGIG